MRRSRHPPKATDKQTKRRQSSGAFFVPEALSLILVNRLSPHWATVEGREPSRLAAPTNGQKGETLRCSSLPA
ncbi:protein of unknown function [Hyphomicrobium sp. 1Nfss2.1]